MSLYDQMRDTISASVPYAKHTGVQLDTLSNGRAEATLPQQDKTLNHIGTQHAGAMFTLGEAASGAAMAGCFASVLTSIRPVAASAEIKYLKIAKGAIKATASVSRSGDDLLAELDEKGRVLFNVGIDMTDGDGQTVAQMTVDWHVSKRG